MFSITSILTGITILMLVFMLIAWALDELSGDNK